MYIPTYIRTLQTESQLQHPFVFWYMRRGKGVQKQTDTNNATTTTITTNNDENNNEKDKNSASNQYESSIRQIASVSTVEQFWSIYDYLVRPSDLPNTTDYHFFREGIKPTWEDPCNAKGGKWIVRLKKGLASRYWEEIILALIGCQFTGINPEEICGAVVSIRYSEDIISVWNKSSTDHEITQKLRDHIKRILQLPSFVHMEYKPHETSLHDKSSFRNTQVWKGTGERNSRRSTTTSWTDSKKNRESDRTSWR
jgi:translation initiation factor 4E